MKQKPKRKNGDVRRRKRLMIIVGGLLVLLIALIAGLIIFLTAPIYEDPSWIPIALTSTRIFQLNATTFAEGTAQAELNARSLPQTIFIPELSPIEMTSTRIVEMNATTFAEATAQALP